MCYPPGEVWLCTDLKLTALIQDRVRCSQQRMPAYSSVCCGQCTAIFMYQQGFLRGIASINFLTAIIEKETETLSLGLPRCPPKALKVNEVQLRECHFDCRFERSV